jgi:hypothetical protein
VAVVEVMMRNRAAVVGEEEAITTKCDGASTLLGARVDNGACAWSE